METKTKSSKRIVLIIICSVLVAAILAFVLFYLSVHRKNRDATFFDSGLNFAEADYETDILSDPYYLRYDRHIMYNEFGDAEPLTEDNYQLFGAEAEFFYRYFDTVIHGDYVEYPSFFTESYLKSHDLPERFTMQRIYDIDVTLYSRENVDYNGTSVPCSQYIVSYRIQYNNGTFRGDFTGKDVRPLLFSLIQENGKVYISVNDSLYNIDDLDTVSDPDYYTATTVAKSFTNMVQALPSEKNLTIYDEEKIKSARTVYDSLTDYQKSFISPDTVKTLEQLEAKLKTLKGNTEDSSKGE